MKSNDRTIQRRGLHVMFLLPGLLALLILGLGGIIFQVAVNMADSFSSESVTAKALNQVAFYSLVASVAMTAVGIVLGVFLSRALVRSMRGIVQKAQSSLIGSLPVEPAESSPTDGFVEVDQIGQTFNQMMRDIYLSFRQRDSILMQGAIYGIVTTDGMGHIMAANTRAEEYLGLKSSNLIGQTFKALAEHKADLSSLHDIIIEVIRQQKLSREEHVEIIDRDAKPRRMMITTSLIQDHFNRPNGCVLMIRPSQRYGELDKRLREIDRLAMLGTFTVGLVHEIRNPIAAIKGLSKLLGQIPPSSPKAKEFVEEIQSEAVRLERLLSELHHLANKSPEELRSACDINQLLSNALSTVRRSNPKPDIHVEEHYTAIPLVLGFADRLVQAFSNILRNAFDATPPGGEITVKTRRLMSADNSGNLVQVLITNTGSTISDEERGKIFEPFYTTKQGGTGLGLPIATQSIIQHDGNVTLHNAENFTTFEILLPGLPDEAGAGILDYTAQEISKESMS